MKNKTGKGTVIFRIVYLTLTLLAAGMIAFALTLLWDGLSAYEKSDPEIPMNALMKEFNKNKSNLVKNLNASVNEFEDKKVLDAYFEALTAGELTFSRNGKKSTEDKVVYNIKAGEGVIAEAEVVKSGNDLGYGFYEYKLENVIFGQVPTHGYTITAPNTARVFCNGIMVSNTYIIDTGEVYPEAEHFQGFLTVSPCDVTYSVSGFIGEAEFTAYDNGGNQLVLIDGRFSPAQIANEEISKIALEFSKAYSRYIVNDGYLSTVADYLAPDMPLYAELEGYENFWHNWHSDYNFLEVEVGDPVFYEEKCAFVRVKYDHVLYGVNSTDNGELHSKADYTVYMVNINGLWKVVNMAFN